MKVGKIIDNVLTYVESSDDVIRILNEAKMLLYKEKTRTNGLIVQPKDSVYIVIGDLHGDIETLRAILDKIEMSRIKDGDLNIVFLGDYIDRGPNQLETFLTALLLKLEFPSSIFTLRGNHEPPKWLTPSPHDFPHLLISMYGYNLGGEIYDSALEIFEELPIALLVEKTALMLHGGLPTTTYGKVSNLRDYLIGRSIDEQKIVLEEILWNDPVDGEFISMPSPRGAGYLFGETVTSWASELLGFKIVIRGHEPVREGFKVNHKGKVITIFSRLGPPYFNECASYYVLDPNSPSLINKPTDLVKTLCL
jgi:protein phosphatase